MLLHRTKSLIQAFAWSLLLSCSIGTMLSLPLSGQTAIGGSTPDPSAMLDVQSTGKGVLFPRMTGTERNNISAPATGLIIFNTTTVCLEINLGSAVSPAWQAIKCLGSISGLNCAGAALTGSLIPNVAASGVSVSVPYVGGNGGVFDAQTVTSTVVTGLTATLSSGSFASGSGNLSYAITGTPSATGTASFALNIGGQTCALDLTVQQPFSISCTNAIRKGEMQPGIAYNAPSGVTVIVPYVDGTGAAHAGQTVMSTGVTGFTATLSAGNFVTGSGNLTYEITGMGNTGTATFALNIGGSSCALDLEVQSCSANIAASTPKTFLCYNLGAYNTRKPANQPSWEINGGYWQWGRKPEAAPGPIGSSAGEANSGQPNTWTPTGASWNISVAGNGAWVDAPTTKSANDPCPDEFRIPTKTQWQGVINSTLNPQSNIGGSTWSSSATNYSTGKNFGSNLFLPAAGFRDGSNGALYNRGNYGYYWSSSENGTDEAWYIDLRTGGVDDYSDGYRSIGFSVRCIKGDNSGS